MESASLGPNHLSLCYKQKSRANSDVQDEGGGRITRNLSPISFCKSLPLKAERQN